LWQLRNRQRKLNKNRKTHEIGGQILRKFDLRHAWGLFVVNLFKLYCLPCLDQTLRRQIEFRLEEEGRGKDNISPRRQ
jgi:hypothetical protein